MLPIRKGTSPSCARFPFCIFCIEIRMNIFAGNIASATVLTLENHCSYTVWPGTLSNKGGVLGNGGFALPAGAAVQLNAPSSWSGRIWARTGCSFDGSGNGKCVTGDCAGGLRCTGSGVPPATLAEFTIGYIGDVDFYDVSLVDGYNVGMSVRDTDIECPSAGCAADLNVGCPEELQVRDGEGTVVACKSGCTAFNTVEFCCTDGFSTPRTCSPSRYSEYFKNACPTAFSYAYDDSSTCICFDSGYIITFCPKDLN
ncbi:hypothetical protein Fmac_029593 [Flemingia macrophylla]|uniref:Thaumatin-like protein n=1 Tax=Flemingia macrophylla TaxID=520843 RepID=A0ABD1LAS3_9FABA